ncbi:hypothetical protein [Streptomyces iranensis]|uniref:Uncharacterized protein n=1 Tax=Streptomyces iranensis TaxID=576784 RepID=A0A061A8L4_9ACTN|nr:hypothetical protein [Streptomyces iranensis]MBP2060059.1 hypothetical protein [Streptomyces iranensis]CDR14116.1 predicted protein [Streptomyces iranensis]
MDDLHAQGARKTTSAGGGVPDASGQAGIIGIGLAAVLTFALAQGAWEWFASYIGVTLLAVILSFYRLPPRRPGLRSAYVPNLIAYSLVVGLCAAIALAPVLQRSAWLFPMPGTRTHCRALGTYESLRTEASLANLAGRDGAALAYARASHRHEAVADCLASTTTRWLPLYGLGAAVLAGLGAWSFGRIRARRQDRARTRRRADLAT